MILEHYAASLGYDSPIKGNRLSITVDERYQLRLQKRPDGRVLISARLRGLPQAGPARDEVLRHCAQLTCGRMLKAPVTCSVDSREKSVWLQQLSNAANTQTLDEHVGDFVNELVFWTEAVKDD